MTRDMLRIIAEVLLNAHTVNMQLYLLAFPPLKLLSPYVCTNCEVTLGHRPIFGASVGPYFSLANNTLKLDRYVMQQGR